MSEWKEYKLGEVISINDKSIDRNYPHKNIAYLDTGSITRGKTEGFQYFDLQYAPSRAKRLVKDNDVIYSTVRPIQRHYGIIKNPKPNLVVSTGFAVLSCDEKKADANFIFYFLTSDEIVNYLDMVAEGSTSAYPSLTPDVIADIDILLPPLSEQKSIASILSSLDDKIDLLHRQNKTLEALAETLFRQWFLPASAGQAGVKEAEGWETGKLGDVISIYDSQRIPVSSMERDKMKAGELYPHYGAATIMDYVNEYIFDGEYILMGEDGTVQTDNGYPILQMAVGKFWVNNHAHIFQAVKPYSNFSIYVFLKQTNISNIVTGAVQPKINQENLKSIEFPIPPDKKVNEFVLITNSYWEKIKRNNEQIRTLTRLRDTLLPKLMSGEVRVKEEKGNRTDRT